MSTLTISQVQDAITVAATNAVNSGSTIGISIGAILGNNPPVTACAGVSNYDTQEPVATDTIFQIGSITKIFTTGYFGQLVSSGAFSLSQLLSDFSNGALTGLPPGLTPGATLSNATLQDIATFAVGLTSAPPASAMGGNPRPTIAEWGVTDFVNWFVQQSPEMKYIYSDICTGMLGLLSTNANPTTSPLPPNAVNVWLDAIESNILQPLCMNDTVVQCISQLTSSQKSRLACGYQQALATADIANGSVSGINVINPGADYTTVPEVSIVSETGTGATATAELSKEGRVISIQVTNGGSGYATVPTVLVAPGKPASNNIPVWAAAGGISSTVNDMLAIVQQCLAAGTNPLAVRTPLQAGLSMAMKSYGHINGSSGTEYGMAWEINNSNAGPVIFKPGGLAGFSSYLCILPQQNLGFIAFCNSRQGNPKTFPAIDTVQSILKSLFG